MSPPYPVVVIHGPQPSWLDVERDGSAEADGILTGHLADFGPPYDLARNAVGVIPNGPSLPGGDEVVRLSAMEIPIPYDRAGVTFPAGSLLLIGGLRLTSGTDIMANNGTPNFASFQGVTDGKNLFGRWLIIQGLPAATTGTVKIRRTSDWKSGTPTIDVETIAVDGANGAEQWIILPTVSAAATLRQTATFYYESTWTGTPPIRELTTREPTAVAYGRVCPDTLPSGYTQVTDPQCENFGAPHWQRNRRWRAYPVSCPGLSPFNRGFTRGATLLSGNDIVPTEIPIPRGIARRFGQPDVSCDLAESIDTSTARHRPYPCIWVGNELLEHGWQPCCPIVFPDGVSQSTSASATPFPVSTVSSSWAVLDIAAGWRDVSAWAFDSGTSGGSITFDGIDVEFGHVVGWGAGVPTVIDGTITFTQAEAAGTDGTLKHLGAAITPSPDTPEAHLYVRLTLRFTRPSDNGEFVFCSSQAHASRRVDIPPAWPAAGPAGVIPGGYKAALLTTPVNLATVQHGVVSETTLIFSHPGGGLTRNFVASFLPDTDGVWKAENSLTPSQAITCGEYEQLTTRRTSHLGRAGKRFYGAIDKLSTSSTSLDIDLVSIAQVLTAVPSGPSGLTILTSHRTDGHWVFLSITVPAAGVYRVSLAASFNTSGTNGPTVFLGLHATDPYVIVPDVSRTREYYPVGALTGVITATPPGTPSDGNRYIIGASATGAWLGEDGNIARWDAPSGAWQFIRPDYANYGAMASTGATRYWRNAGDNDWSTGSGELLSADLSMPAAGTFYVRLGKHDPDGVTSSDSVLDGLLTPVVTWASL